MDAALGYMRRNASAPCGILTVKWLSSPIQQPIMTTPLVSVLVVSYNQEDFIEEALRSALDQDYDNLRVVIADDGSTDRTPEFIMAIAEEYPGRLVPLVGGPNLGITGNSNRALEACEGKYVAFMGGDDVLLPGKIRAQVRWMEERPNLVMSYHDLDVFDSESGTTLWIWTDHHTTRSGGAACVVENGTFMGATSVMVRLDLVPDLKFDPRIPISSDWLYWIEVLAISGKEIGFMPGIYARYRRHSRNVTVTHYLGHERWETLRLVAERYPWLEASCHARYPTLAHEHLATILIHGRWDLFPTGVRMFVRHATLRRSASLLASTVGRVLTDLRHR